MATPNLAASPTSRAQPLVASAAMALASVCVASDRPRLRRLEAGSAATEARLIRHEGNS